MIGKLLLKSAFTLFESRYILSINQPVKASAKYVHKYMNLFLQILLKLEVFTTLLQRGRYSFKLTTASVIIIIIYYLFFVVVIL